MAHIRLIVGLGNIGSQYQGTRHNAGEWFLTSLSTQLNAPLKLQPKFHGYIGAGIIQGQKVLLLYPATYMNKSGLAVAAVSRFYKIAADEILIAHDELDLPSGAIRLKKSGGHGGHNGLRDIEKALGSRNFYRLRIGISHPQDREKVLGYVLGKPAVDDKITIDSAIERAISYIDDIVALEHEKVMNQLHCKAE